MLSHWKKFIIVTGFAALLVFVTVTASKAMPLAQVPLPDDCQECHESIQQHWEESAHGQAVTDPIFQEAWLNAGSPVDCLACHTTGFDAETGTWEEDGITCAACHQLPDNSSHHPEQVMPTDVSSRACGTCHVDTHAEWQVSEHSQSEMACNRCHNPHTTELKTGSVQELCIACHNEESYFYEFTAHAAEGLLCTDCHLNVSDTELGEGHGRREHTFQVDLATCNQCHDQEMHAPMVTDSAMSEIGMADTTAVSATEVSCEQLFATDSVVHTAQSGVAYAAEPYLTSQPASANGPLTYLVPAGFGLIFGMMLAPWVEGIYRRRRGGR
ncbi:MAG: hypothetical protein H6662_09820 [Ardenticatenaceae bacterium]|nr:hypothetical protein [Anaerolineales bacterium]MCB8921871.1 hypothetical protein [Ardenticatenaceae bacterium]